MASNMLRALGTHGDVLAWRIVIAAVEMVATQPYVVEWLLLILQCHSETLFAK